MPEALNLASRVRISPEVVSEELDGETVLLHMRTGIYYGLDQVGTTIWRLLRSNLSLEDVLDELLSEYEVCREECAGDLLRVVNEMRDLELVELQA
ncbi:MAG: PqqD family protein [Terriglobales bacterium]